MVARPAMEPLIRATVMMAKAIWKPEKMTVGMEPFRLVIPTSCIIQWAGEPIRPQPPTSLPNARL